MNIQVNIVNEEQWNGEPKVSQVLKKGITMKPPLIFNVFGLLPDASYHVAIGMKQCDSFQYKLVDGRWIANKNSQIDATQYKWHDDGAKSGKEWMESRIDFSRMSVTNDASKTHMAYAKSLHKYIPELIILENGNNQATFTMTGHEVIFVTNAIKDNDNAKRVVRRPSPKLVQQQQFQQLDQPQGLSEDIYDHQYNVPMLQQHPSVPSVQYYPEQYAESNVQCSYPVQSNQGYFQDQQPQFYQEEGQCNFSPIQNNIQQDQYFNNNIPVSDDVIQYNYSQQVVYNLEQSPEGQRDSGFNSPSASSHCQPIQEFVEQFFQPEQQEEADDGRETFDDFFPDYDKDNQQVGFEEPLEDPVDEAVQPKESEDPYENCQNLNNIPF